MKMSEKILLLRKKAGWSQEDLALELGVSRQSVYKWESEASLPEIDKIKAIAKLFNVSFDYLMDDEIEEGCGVSRIIGEKGIKRRAVYYSGNSLNPIQLDIDNGNVKERRVKPLANDYYKCSKENMDSAMQALGVKECLILQPFSAIAYFYDEKELIFGFYYAGEVQFACPIENLIEFKRGGQGKGTFIQRQVSVGGVGVGLGLSGGHSIGVSSGSVPVLDFLPATETDFVISYQDGDEVKEFKMAFTVNTQNLLNMCDEHPEQYNVLLQVEMDSLDKNLKTLEFKLSTLREEVKRKKDIIETLPKDGVERYQVENVYFREEYEALLKRMAKEARQDNRLVFFGRTIKWIIILGAIGFGIGFIIWTCNQGERDYYARLLPTIFSKGKGFFSHLLK